MPDAQGEALGGGHARLGDAHHHVGVDGRLLGQLLAHAHPGLVDVLAVERGVGAGEVHELEQAQPGVDLAGGEGPHRAVAGGVDDDHLAGLELADELGADEVERRRLRRQHPPGLDAAEAQRPEAVGSRTPTTWASSMHTIENAPSSCGSTSSIACSRSRSSLRSSSALDGPGEHLDDEVAVGGDLVGAGQHAQLGRRGRRC